MPWGNLSSRFGTMNKAEIGACYQKLEYFSRKVGLVRAEDSES
jgi:hypothetical protein